MKHYAGKALPGEELRTKTLDYREITETIGTVVPGTLNAFFDDDLELGPPAHFTEHYEFWPCEIATVGMIRRGEPSIPGHIIRVLGENFPPNFIEVLSPVHIRTSLKKTNFPAFPIEISL